MNIEYLEKYLKYKNKYLNLRYESLRGGLEPDYGLIRVQLNLLFNSDARNKIQQFVDNLQSDLKSKRSQVGGINTPKIDEYGSEYEYASEPYSDSEFDYDPEPESEPEFKKLIDEIIKTLKLEPDNLVITNLNELFKYDLDYDNSRIYNLIKDNIDYIKFKEEYNNYIIKNIRLLIRKINDLKDIEEKMDDNIKNLIKNIIEVKLPLFIMNDLSNIKDIKTSIEKLIIINDIEVIKRNISLLETNTTKYEDIINLLKQINSIIYLNIKIEEYLKEDKKYYFDIDMPSWRYCYQFNEAPFISDLYEYLNDNINTKFIDIVYEEPINIETQLLSVIPLQYSKNIFSNHIEKKYNKNLNDNVTKFMFPEKPHIELNKEIYWMCEPILPQIDLDLVK